MGVRTRLVVKSLLLFSLTSALFLIGCSCGNNCEGAKCVPRSPWQSPTIQVTRALLLVNRAELRILYIDGHDAHPTCVSAQGVEEYHLLPGRHTLVAVFRYSAPPSEGVLADVHGEPLTMEYEFLAQHEYVAVYREHEGTAPAGELYAAEVATNVLNPPELYWTLDVVDIADAGPYPEPEVADAQAYLSWVRPGGSMATQVELSITH